MGDYRGQSNDNGINVAAAYKDIQNGIQQANQ